MPHISFGQTLLRFSGGVAGIVLGVSLMVPAFAETNSPAESFKRWGLSTSRVEVMCLDSYACRGSEQKMLKWLAGGFDRVPSFLRGTDVWSLSWHELPKGKPIDGLADDRKNKITLSTDRQVVIDEVLTHEIAHLYIDRGHYSTQEKFLTLRYGSEEFRKKMSGIGSRSRALKDAGWTDAKVFEALNALASEIQFPQRFPKDFHALTRDEYFPVCIELYHRHQKNGTLDDLAKVLSPAEMEFLATLFASGDSSSN